VSQDEFFLLCDRCLWRKFHDLPKGRVRRELVKKVFVSRVFDKQTA
jgi:hypothetical protein